MMPNEDTPLYTIGTAADLLKVHPRTLRLYEQAGLLRPARKNNRRFYTNHDLEWIRCIRYMIHERGLNQEGLRRLLATIPCWKTRGCTEDARARCAAYLDRSGPCWQVSTTTCDSNVECFRCAVYLGAFDHVCDKKDRVALGMAEPQTLLTA
jgi:MerR family transcriptional regulator, heat shock protein HspR